MSTQRLFLILSLVLILSGIGWYLFIYKPIQINIKQTKLEVHEITQNLKNARKAKNDLHQLESRLETAKADLEAIKQHIVNRKNLTRVTKELQRVAEEYDLEITDFSPILDSYFETTGNEHIKPLPIIIKLTGRYLQIGKFLEALNNLDFYLTPNELVIEKLDPEKNDLTATITCILYTWNS